VDWNTLGSPPALLCSASFRTGSIRNVPQSEKYEVEAEYGMAQRLYGCTLEIDHIIPLELGARMLSQSSNN
jgi:hypothetical protein